MDQNSNTNWDLIIRPKSGWFDLHLSNIWHYRDLTMFFVWRDFVAQYKQTILNQEHYREIDHFCRSLKIMWFASCWDEKSVDFIEQFDPPCYQIASACLTDDNLLRFHRQKGGLFKT
jgi:hypothetical protein